MNIVDLINRISGREVKRVVAGGSNGSVIILRVGEDEFSIRIQRVWRLEHRGGEYLYDEYIEPKVIAA